MSIEIVECRVGLPLEATGRTIGNRRSQSSIATVDPQSVNLQSAIINLQCSVVQVLFFDLLLKGRVIGLLTGLLFLHRAPRGAAQTAARSDRKREARQ